MDHNTPTVLSLCSGAGGLELGLKLAVPGSRTVCYVEGEAYAAAQLAARMADETMDAAPVWSDVKTFDPEPWRGCVDIITAGYPCQPFSIAGAKRAEKDPRHLWPYIREIVRIIKPRVCSFENVSHHLRLGFEQVHDDLRSMGYRVATGLFTAEEVGAPHKRERLFILAYRESVLSERTVKYGDPPGQPKETLRKFGSDVADRDSNRFRRKQGPISGKDDPQGRAQCAENAITGGNSHAAEQLPLHETGSSSPQRGQGLSNSQSAMADTTRAGARIDQCLPRNRTGRDGESMADTCSAGLERQSRDEGTPHGASFLIEDGIYIWPPRPGDHERWGCVPDALKPAVHRMADGMAYRVDRLRACGNGVVPLVAAYAFFVLGGHRVL